MTFAEEFFSYEKHSSLMIGKTCCIVINANEPFRSNEIAVLFQKRHSIFCKSLSDAYAATGRVRLRVKSTRAANGASKNIL